MIKRRSAVAHLIDAPQRPLVVAGLGSPVYDVFAAGDHPLNFYNWGAMGSASMVGLGLALSQPDRSVIVFTGDGEMLMGLGSLCTIAQHKPRNLSIVVLDNEQYAETGMQTTATGFGTDLAVVANACGIRGATTLRTQEEVSGLRSQIEAQSGLTFAVLKIEKGDQPRTVPLRDGAATTYRFRSELLGQHIAEGL
jgi:thiamine pyrophosphate-dependent acetolactate synthase large subunit-like protein